MAITELPADAYTNPILDTFWLRPADVIDAQLDELRAGPMQFYAEPVPPPESPIPQGPGAWVVLNHADIVHMSKNPKLFSSAKGIVVGDMPLEIVEFFHRTIVFSPSCHRSIAFLKVSPS